MSEKKIANQKLSEIVQRSACRYELMKVRAVDGHEYEVQVHPLNDAEFVTACANAEIHASKDDATVDLGSNMKLLAAVATVATEDPKIAEVLAPFETAKIGKRVLEISGLMGAPAGKTEQSDGEIN